MISSMQILKYFVIMMIPDFVIAWLFMQNDNDKWSTFFWVLLILFLVQLFFGIKNIIAGSLSYRIFARKELTDGWLLSFEHHKFPAFEENDIDYYLQKVAFDKNTPIESRLQAAKLFGQLEGFQHTGFFSSMRMKATSNEALGKFIELNRSKITVPDMGHNDCLW